MRLRLADLLGGLSVACDLGFGLPPEQAMRACLIGTGLARRMGCDEAAVSDAFYTALLVHVGCSALSHESALAFGDEKAMTEAVSRTNVADPEDIARTLMPALLAGKPESEQRRIQRYVMEHGDEFGVMFDTGSCEVASRTAARVGLGAGVARSLKEVVEWWNGMGPPDGLAGEEIALPARIARAAADAARFDGLGGADAVAEALRARADVILDPAVVEELIAGADELLGDARTGDPRERLLEVEPQPVVEVADAAAVARAFGDLADLKMPWTHGHSAGVATLARSAATALRLDAERVETAALLHDIGRVAVGNAVWEKPGPLTGAEREQARMHAYFSERILATSEGLTSVARLAGSHHERLDGSGYHRGSGARDLAPEVRVLAAADCFQAMTQARPHRPALPPEQAADELRAEVRAGRLDGDAAGAVLEAAGAGRQRRRDNLRPAGLTEREVDVARLVAAGLNNPQIAERLVISRRTAEHHVQHIYAKVGIASRAGLALFVHEHHLLEDR